MKEEMKNVGCAVIRQCVLALLALALAGNGLAKGERHPDRPNIVIILADDLGYGDLQCYNKDGLILTPNLDRLAKSGVRFTNGHTSSSVCTPTRYSLLTGRYNWRSYNKNYVLGSFAKPLIEEGRTTIASFLKEKNYATGLIGKWHLGMGWRNSSNEIVHGPGLGGNVKTLNIDYRKDIDGPLEKGFDYFYGIPGSLGMSPCCFIRNKNVVGKLTTVASDTTVEGGTYPKKYYFMAPGAHIEENFDFRKVMDDITGDAKKYIASKANKKNPFFLYFSLTAPHTPVMPAERFWGKGATGTLRHKHFDKGYPDFVYQVDDTVGEIMKTLDAQNVLEDTLIFFIADNGAAAKACNYLTMVNKGGHDPSGGLKGTKGSIYEGGHRVPFIVSWKNRIEPQVCDNLVGVTDLFATLAELVDYKYPDSAGEDSISFLPYLKGQTKGIREDFVTQSVVGDLAITEGNYKAIFTKAHGSWGQHHTIAGNPGLPKFQLYDLDNDLAETTNLYSEDGDSESNEILERLQKKLQQYILKGRSTPGAEQENYGDIVLFHNSSKVFEIQGFNKRQTDKHTKTYFMEHHSQETKSDEK